MTGLAFSLLLAATVPLGVGTDTRVGGKLLRTGGFVYAVGGGNVGGAAQIRRVALDAELVPTGGLVNCGRVYDGPCGSTCAAIMNNRLFVTGGDVKGVTVRYDVLPDGSLANRAEFTDSGAPKTACSSMVASGRYLVTLGGWQSRQVRVAEVAADGSVGPWKQGRPLPTISFSSGRAFRAGNRIYVSGNPVYRGATDRVYSCEVDRDGLPGKWRRWAELPESAWNYDFALMPDGKNVFYANRETGGMYVAKLLAAGETGVEGEPAEAGEIGEWKLLPGRLPTDVDLSCCAIPLRTGYFRLSILIDDPREFKPADLTSYLNR